MLLCSTLLSKEGFAHAFPTRVAKDRDLLALLGTDEVVEVKQVHGGRAIEADVAAGAEADAIIARRAGAVANQVVAVGVRVADCVPILVADPRSGDVAAVHAGWRGVVADVVPAAVRALAKGPLIAAIGPCIGACCFEVGRDVAARIARACRSGRVVVWEAGDRAYVDLRAAVRAQLLALEFAEAHVDDVPGCTSHDAERFHSYRRDGAECGRMLAAIATRR